MLIPRGHQAATRVLITWAVICILTWPVGHYMQKEANSEVKFLVWFIANGVTQIAHLWWAISGWQGRSWLWWVGQGCRWLWWVGHWSQTQN